MTAHYWNTKKLLEEVAGGSRVQLISMLRMDARSLRFQVKIGNFSDGLYYTLKERVKKTHFIIYGLKPRTYVNYMYWDTCYDN